MTNELSNERLKELLATVKKYEKMRTNCGGKYTPDDRGRAYAEFRAAFDGPACAALVREVIKLREVAKQSEQSNAALDALTDRHVKPEVAEAFQRLKD